MKHVGMLIKEQIEKNHLVKKEIADACGISPNYLSQLFSIDNIKLDLYEKLCKATGMNPLSVFDCELAEPHMYCSENNVCNNVGNASLVISSSHEKLEALQELLAEKERTIKILLHQLGLDTETKTGRQ